MPCCSLNLFCKLFCFALCQQFFIELFNFCSLTVSCHALHGMQWLSTIFLHRFVRTMGANTNGNGSNVYGPKIHIGLEGSGPFDILYSPSPLPILHLPSPFPSSTAPLPSPTLPSMDSMSYVHFYIIRAQQQITIKLSECQMH